MWTRIVYNRRSFFFRIILFICSLLSAWIINSINLHELQKSDPGKVRAGVTVITSDDASYLVPAENFIRTGAWKDQFPGRGAYIQRPPGYGLFYLVCRMLTGDPVRAITLIWFLQLLLFACSAVALYEISRLMFGDTRMTRFTCLIYGVSPFAQGFLFYTITEGITPALLIIFAWGLIRPAKVNLAALAGPAVLFSFIVLVRPFLALFLLFPVLLILFQKNKTTVDKISLLAGFILISLGPLATWLFRNYSVTGEYTGLHPIYYRENNTIFREPHRAIGSFAKQWGQRSEDFHASMSVLWESAVHDSGQSEAVSNALRGIPDWVIQETGKENLEHAFTDYIHSAGELRNYYLQGLPVPGISFDSEKKVIQEFTVFTNTLNRKHFFYCHVLVPLKCFTGMAVHSNLSLAIFQHAWRGRPLTEWVRVLFTGLHAIVFFIALPGLFFFRREKRMLFLLIVINLALLYLAVYQRMVEERYTLPLLPFLLLMIPGFIKQAMTITRKHPEIECADT